jgi:hypothetical protein
MWQFCDNQALSRNAARKLPSLSHAPTKSVVVDAGAENDFSHQGTGCKKSSPNFLGRPALRGPSRRSHASRDPRQPCRLMADAELAPNVARGANKKASVEPLFKRAIQVVDPIIKKLFRERSGPLS